MKHLGFALFLVLLAPLAVALRFLDSQDSGEPAQPATSTGEHAIAIAAPLEGVWREVRPGPSGDSFIEELWSAPQGDNVVGAFRWLGPGGRASMYEILTITAEEDGLFLRLRHFGADLEAWEGRTEPKTLRLDEAGPTRLSFAAHAHCGDLASVTYDRSEEDVLAIVVAFLEESQRPPLRFRLERLRG